MQKHSFRSLVLNVVPLALLATLVFFAGCTNQKKVTYDSSGMTTTFSEDKNGVPGDLKPFIYPEAKLAGVSSAQDKEGEEAKYLSMTSKDSMEKVTEWYTNALKSNGYTIDDDDEQPRSVNISGHKDKVEINITMAEEGEKTTISVSQGKSVDDPADEHEMENFTPNEDQPTPTD
ncbi:MAG: hypothetical protein SFY67_04870 [Candidatus Melainabacteria bacterium]|nr:hypothetical protein [Candidatus Melainabacteria bacterium]